MKHLHDIPPIKHHGTYVYNTVYIYILPSQRVLKRGVAWKSQRHKWSFGGIPHSDPHFSW